MIMPNQFIIFTDILFIAFLTWCSVTDLKKREIPNTAILLMLGLAAVHIIGAVCLGHPWYEYPIGALFTFPFFLAWQKGFFGGGDVKLLFAMGLYLGVSMMLISLAFALVICVGLLIWRTVNRSGIHVRLPLAPVLSLSAAVTVALSYLF